jgi:hypothetical protein
MLVRRNSSFFLTFDLGGGLGLDVVWERLLGGYYMYAQVDEHFAGTRLGHVKINDFGRDLAGLIVDACFVGAR